MVLQGELVALCSPALVCRDSGGTKLSAPSKPMNCFKKDHCLLITCHLTFSICFEGSFASQLTESTLLARRRLPNGAGTWRGLCRQEKEQPERYRPLAWVISIKWLKRIKYSLEGLIWSITHCNCAGAPRTGGEKSWNGK